MNSTQREEQDRRLAGIFTIVIYAALLAIFIFTVVWSPPDPPIPVYGIEVNFGTADAGSGRIQSQSKANNNNNLDDARPNTTPVTETRPTTQPAQPTPERVVEQPVARPVVTEDPNSPDIRNDQKISPPVVNRPTEQLQRTEQPSNTESGRGAGDKSTANNNGNVAGATGDQGKPDGSLNTDALMGSGGSGGTALDLAGWTWDTRPVVNDKSSETGRLEFEIRVDRNGDVVGVRLLFRSVSPSVARLYEEALREVSFRPTAAGARPSITVGRVIFNITSR
ncbi:hypothetical protein [Rhodoflexus sp.]